MEESCITTEENSGLTKRSTEQCGGTELRDKWIGHWAEPDGRAKIGGDYLAVVT